MAKTSESIKKMRKAMIAKATKGFTITQIKQIITDLIKLKLPETDKFLDWLYNLMTK